MYDLEVVKTCFEGSIFGHENTHNFIKINLYFALKYFLHSEEIGKLTQNTH
jgi:hypothetical protein